MHRMSVSADSRGSRTARQLKCRLTWVMAIAARAAQPDFPWGRAIRPGNEQDRQLMRIRQFPPTAPLRLVVMGIVAAAAVPAFAAPPGPGWDTELETITVYARRLTPVSGAAATVTVIDQARIAATLATDIREIVRYEPGISVRNDPFRFGLDTIAVRGLGGNRVAVEIDGIPAAGGFAMGSYADSGRAFVDLAFVDRVELLRGPASSLYGSDAIGGVVAMTTLTPARRARTGRGSIRRRTEAGYDTENDGWHAAVLARRNGGRSGLARRLLVHRRPRVRHGGGRHARPEPTSPADSVMVKFGFARRAGRPADVDRRRRTDAASDVRRSHSSGLGRRFLNTIVLSRATTTAALPGQRRDRPLDRRDRGSTTPPTGACTGRAPTRDQDTYEVRRAVPPRTPPVQLDRAFRLRRRTSASSSPPSGQWRAARSCTTSSTASRRRVLSSRSCATGCRPI